MPATLTLRPRDRIKLAAGDVQTFENSLATIGRSFLSPKAPGLFAHEVGFQVLDQDDDNSRAVGVFGFRIGRRMFYVPMFYRNGTVKGTEQLRDPKRKRAVPLSDNWVNKILSERGDDPPERMSRAHTQDTALPTLWQLKYPPSKYAAALTPEELDLIRVDLAGVISGPPRLPGSRVNDLDLFKIAGEHPAIMAGVNRLFAGHTWFREAVARFHGPAKVAAALAAADQAPSINPAVLGSDTLVRATKRAGSLTVIRIRSVDLHKGPGLGGIDFSPEDLGELKAGRNAYRDGRKDAEVAQVTAWVGGIDADGERLANPTTSGVYEVLGEDHAFHQCVVLTNLVGWRPECMNKVLVVRPGDNAWTLAHHSNVWVRNEDAALVADRTSGKHGALHHWAEELKKVDKEVPTGRHAAVCLTSPGVVVTTMPFDRWEGGCSMTECPDRPAPFWAPHDPRNLRPYTDPRAPDYCRRVEVFPDPGHGLPVVSGSQLYLPPTAKLVKLDGSRLALGDGSDPERTLFQARKKAGELLVGVEHRATGWVVEGPAYRPVKAAHAADAEAVLVAAHGLRVPDARRLMAAADTNPGRRAQAVVKYADGRYGLAHNAPNSPHLDFDQLSNPNSFADDIMPTESGGSAAIPIDDMLAPLGAADRYRPYPLGHGTLRPLPGIGNGGEPAPPSGPSDSDLQAVAGAAGTGRRELFDTSALAALVKHTRLASLLERVREGMAKTTTDLADLLAHLYWNTSEWADQYGQTEVGPLEDELRSQFEGLGELGLKLQEKAVDSSIDPGLLPKMNPAEGGD